MLFFAEVPDNVGLLLPAPDARVSVCHHLRLVARSLFAHRLMRAEIHYRAVAVEDEFDLAWFCCDRGGYSPINLTSTRFGRRPSNSP